MLRFATLMAECQDSRHLTGPVYEAVAYERLATLCVTRAGLAIGIWPAAGTLPRCSAHCGRLADSVVISAG